MSEANLILEGLGSLDKPYKSITTIFDDLYSRIDSVNKKGLTNNNLLRAYYFEVVGNIELLSIVNKEIFKNEKPNSEMLKGLVSRIETEVATAIIFNENIDEHSDIYKLLESKGKIQNNRNLLIKKINGKETDVKTKTFYENILQAVSFTVIKTQILKRITEFSEIELEMLIDIQLDRRITNIMERFKMIKLKLEELPAINSIAR